MALLTADSNGLQIKLSGREQLFGLKRSFNIPWTQVLNIAQVSDLWVHLRGMRAPGTGFPGVIMLGTTRYRGHKDFNAVYGHKPGVVISLTENSFTRVLLTRDDRLSLPERPATQ